jgi:hypothetical protein
MITPPYGKELNEENGSLAALSQFCMLTDRATGMGLLAFSY